MKSSLLSHDASSLAQALNLKPFQARQILRWIFAKRIFDFQQMTDLPITLRNRLEADFSATGLRVAQTRQSPVTGTKKILFALADNATVESVLIRDEDRYTLCVSSQAGCALDCAFCATGASGFVRNLEAHEIVAQALHLLEGEDLGERTPNIVYMGMGEPLANYDAVHASIQTLMDPAGFGVAARKITVSTVGEVKGIDRFSQEDWQVRLSISLHAANDTLRSKLIPLNKKYSLAVLRRALDRYLERMNRQITFEWVLLDGVNDARRDADELLAYARGLKATVNLIPWNPVPGLDFRPSPPAQREQFMRWLNAAGLKTTIRQEKGQDIEAACGQLRRANKA